MMTPFARLYRIGLPSLVFLFLTLGSPLYAQFDVLPGTDIFVNFGDIKGESIDEAHRDWVDAISYSDQISTSQSPLIKWRPQTSAVVFSPVTIVKLIDASTPKLREAACKGTHFPEVYVEFVRPGATPFKYLEIKLKEVLVTSVSTTIPSAEQEVVTLEFGGIEMIYTKQKQDGTAGGTVEFKWSIPYLESRN